MLSYFLSIGQTFDLVVNIDGFNEVTLSSFNNQRGLDISMPSAMHLDPLVNLVNQATLTPEKLQSLAAISQYKERINYLVGRLQHNRIAAINFVLERLHRSATASYQAEVARFAALRLESLGCLADSGDAERHATRRGQGACRRREKLVRSLGADADDARGTRHSLLSRPAAEPVLHDADRSAPRRPRSRARMRRRSRQAPRRAIPLLVAESEGLKSRVNFLNATGIFDRESAAVYMDDCCHYTLRGNQLLADAIARQILSSKGAWN